MSDRDDRDPTRDDAERIPSGDRDVTVTPAARPEPRRPAGFAAGAEPPGGLSDVARAMTAAMPGLNASDRDGTLVLTAPDGRAVTVSVGSGEDGRAYVVSAPGVPPDVGGIRTPLLEQAVDHARSMLGYDEGETRPNIAPGL